jgi:hypothetical protein
MHGLPQHLSADPAGHDEPGSESLYSVALPEGIDCQRCHGPGANHIRIAGTNSESVDELRRAIVNPARLSGERQMEVCMQGHLETTSMRLPHSIRRYGQEPFSYLPSEPLSNFMIFFDHAPGSKYKNDFEIAHSAIDSASPSASSKAATNLPVPLVTNPHDIPRGEQAALHYNGVCRECHKGALSSAHTTAPDCVSCHMPKRRTQDVVHAVMTDHLIQRRTPPNPLAQIPERQEFDANQYHGQVVPYYPSPLPRTSTNALYVAVANGLPRLMNATANQKPAQAEFCVELGQAWLSRHNPAKAIPAFEEAAKRKPDSPVVLLNLGDALSEAGQPARVIVVLNHAVRVAPLIRYCGTSS